MRQLTVVWLLVATLPLACSEASMQNGQQSTLAHTRDALPEEGSAPIEAERNIEPSINSIASPAEINDQVESDAPEQVPAEQEPLVAEEKAIELPPPAPEPKLQLDPVALEPIAIGGAYLVCIQSSEVNCRIDSDTQKNIPVDPNFTLDFTYQGAVVSFTESRRSGWRWKLTPSALVFGAVEVKLKISLNGDVVRTLRANFETNPIQIGDGTKYLQGCPVEVGREARFAGVQFAKAYQLTRDQSIVIDMQGLCGIIRPNDTYVQIVDSSSRQVFKAFLPTTSAPIDRHFVISNLPAGSYMLKLVPGNDVDIDDFFVNNLSISLRSL